MPTDRSGIMPPRPLLLVLFALLARCTNCLHTPSWRTTVSHAWRQLSDSQSTSASSPKSLEQWSCVDIGTWLQAQQVGPSRAASSGGNPPPAVAPCGASAVCQIPLHHRHYGCNTACSGWYEYRSTIQVVASRNRTEEVLKDDLKIRLSLHRKMLLSLLATLRTDTAPQLPHVVPTPQHLGIAAAPDYVVRRDVDCTQRDTPYPQVILQYLSMMSVPRSTLAAMLTWHTLRPALPEAATDSLPTEGSPPRTHALAGTRTLLERLHAVLFAHPWVREQRTWLLENAPSSLACIPVSTSQVRSTGCHSPFLPVPTPTDRHHRGACRAAGSPLHGPLDALHLYVFHHATVDLHPCRR